MDAQLIAVTVFGMILLAGLLVSVGNLVLQLLLAVINCLIPLAKIAGGIQAVGMIAVVVINITQGLPVFSSFWLGWARVIEVFA